MCVLSESLYTLHSCQAAAWLFSRTYTNGGSVFDPALSERHRHKIVYCFNGKIKERDKDMKKGRG
jgi:hypothetical protein